jgi:formylglycine-generating enzyme required for sulfatase activity
VTSPLHDVAATDPEASEWYRACSNAGTLLYPYGTSFEHLRCNDTNGHVEVVGTFTACEGGYEAVFDMSGNVNEWEDACTNYGSRNLAAENCLRVGGAYYDGETNLTCGKDMTGATVNHQTLPGLPSNGTGFRCCQ